MTLIRVAGIDVGDDLRLLTDAHVGELGLLEIRREVQLAERDDRQQRLSDLHPISHVGRLVSDDAGERRRNLRVAEIELGGFQSGFGLLDDWTIVARLVVGLGSERGLSLGQLMLRERLIGRRDAQTGVGLIVLLGGDNALLLQRLGALIIDLCLLELRLHQRHARSRRLHSSVQLIDGLPGALELSLRLLDLDLEVARIERQQQLSFLNRPIVLDVNAGDGPSEARGHQRDGAVNVGVVGADVTLDVAIVVISGNRNGGDCNDHDDQDYPAHELRVHRIISDAGRSRCFVESLTC